MTIIDRYLLFLFIKIFSVCFVSFTGLFIVIHLFSNLDELTAISKSQSWPRLIWEFYGPRTAELFEKTAAVWALVSAVFAVSLMQRRREMTAIEAAGITKTRILRSVLLFSLVIIGVSIAARELILPQVRDKLVRTAQDWENQADISMGTYQDLQTGIKIRGAVLSLEEHKIADVEVQWPNSRENAFSRIQASWAIVTPANEQHEAGLLLREIKMPVDNSQLKTNLDDPNQAVYWSGDTPWLQPNQCFVECNFDPYQAAYGRKLLGYQSFPELLNELRKPQHWFGNDSTQIQVHSRLLQPVLDLTLLLLGLPMMIGRNDKNIFVSAGLCFFIVGAMQLTTIGCHSLGSFSFIQPSALAAWLPVILFSPLAVVAFQRIDT